MDDHVETEFKLRAVRPIEPAALDAAIREAGFACRAIEARRHVDVYLDDARRSLAGASHGLRLRDSAGRRTLTCKDAGRRDGALFVRNETEAPWPGAEPPRTASALPDVVRDVVEPIVLDRPLLETMRLRVDRETRHLRADGRDLCAVTLDSVHVETRERTATFVEIEIEVTDADDLATCERLAQTLTETLPVRAATEDKPTHAATLLGIHVPPRAPAPLDADAPAATVLAALLAQHAATAARAEAGVRAGRDPTHVHTMRVALRRTRGLVRAFRDAFDDATGTFLLDHLGDANRRLGALRDLDVAIASFAAARDELPAGLQAAADRLLPWIAGQRAAQHAQVRAWLRSPLRITAEQRAGAALAAPAGGDLPTTTVRAAVRPRIEKLAERARRLVAALPHDLPFAATHEVRIAVKRLRYVADEFAALLEPGIEKSLALAVRLQSDLGVVCDHERAMQHLIAWLPDLRDAGDAEQLAVLGALTALHARAARGARKRALRTLAKFDRKKVWRRFLA